MEAELSNGRLILSLPVHLTDDELLMKGRELAALERETDQADAERKAISKEMGEKVKEMRERALTMAQVIETKQEKRPVECVQHKNWVASTVETVRSDTGEVVQERPMSERDRQEAMFEKDDEAGASAAA